MLKQDYLHEIQVEYENYLEGLEDVKKTYILNRLIKQIAWYDGAAVRYKRKFNFFTTFSIMLTAVLPCLTRFHAAGTVIAIVSTASVMITTLVNTLDYHNLWVEYRMICERLKSTLHQYMTGTGIFSSISKEKQFSVLVELSEECMSKELKSWNGMNTSKERILNDKKN